MTTRNTSTAGDIYIIFDTEWKTEPRNVKLLTFTQ